MSQDLYISEDQWAFMMWYDETADYVPPPAPNQTTGWTYIMEPNVPINPGQGYAYYQNPESELAETSKVTFSGQLKSSDASYGTNPSPGFDLLSYSGPPIEQFGWNLIGNPFTASLQEGVGTGVYMTDMEPALWIWEGGETSNYIVWRYKK